MKKTLTTSNSRCNEIRENLSAQFDVEELTLSDEVIEDHLTGCDECARYKSALKTLHARLCRELAEKCDSDAIWKGIQERIKEDQSAARVAPEHAKTGHRPGYPLQPSRIRRKTVFALVASVLLCVVVSGSFVFQGRDTGMPLATETLRDYETFRVRGSQLDIEVSSSDELIEWMTGKVDFSLPEKVRPPMQFQVAGGRICSFLNRRLAFFYYEKDTQSLSLYVMKANGLSVPNKGELKSTTDDSGLTTVTWEHNELAFVIVSDLPLADVMKFANRA